MTLLNATHQNNAVLKSIQQKAYAVMPQGTEVILFGSRARNDAKDDSDWDILVLLDKTKIEEADHDNYCYPLWELGWEMNQMIHPIIYTKNEWQKRKGTPLYENIETEGIALC